MRRVLWCVLAVAALLIPATPMGGERAALRSERPEPPDRGRVLRVGVTRLPTLDPAQARTPDQVLVAEQLFDGLTAVDPATLEPVPALASRWQASADQRQWDFVLRAGATFSNGRPITSADVKYTLERVARGGSGSQLLQLVTGFDPFHKNAAPQLVGVTTPSLDIVHISLDQPWAALPLVLSNPLFGVVARESVEAQAGPTIADEPVASGPFEVDRVRGQTIYLVPAAGISTRLTGIDLVRFDDEGTAYQAFKDGDLDFARVPRDEVSDAGRRYGREGFRPYLAELFYAFNLKNPKFGDPRFREAIVRAINRRAIVTAIYQGTVRPTDSTVLEGVQGFQENACDRCGYDPGLARALLADIFKGRPPPPVAIDYDDDAAQEAIAKSIQASLQGVGIPVALRPKGFRDFDAFALSGEAELFRSGWFAYYPSADAILPPLFESGSLNNLTGFANPGVDAQLRAARAEPNQARRVELFKQVDRAVMSQLPVVPIAQFNVHSVVSKRAKGLRLDNQGSFDATPVRLG